MACRYGCITAMRSPRCTKLSSRKKWRGNVFTRVNPERRNHSIARETGTLWPIWRWVNDVLSIKERTSAFSVNKGGHRRKADIFCCAKVLGDHRRMWKAKTFANTFNINDASRQLRQYVQQRSRRVPAVPADDRPQILLNNFLYDSSQLRSFDK